MGMCDVVINNDDKLITIFRIMMLSCFSLKQFNMEHQYQNRETGHDTFQINR